jgi:hypothetical protein
MKKQLLAAIFTIAGASLVAQTPRLSLYEEFTGETCPPCAATNPGLNALLAQPQNTANCVAIKWQVPIPSAPTNTWSLYQTNKVEINWRYSTYGYGINSAPSGRMDGQLPTVFGASSAHPATLNSGVIATAQSYTSAFSITMTRAWDPTYSSINVSINITATAPFTSVGNLIFRLVMVEKYIQFATQPGTNGETIFEDVAIKSFPTIQSGTSMASTWTVGQTQTINLNCPVPSYCRDKGEIAFVGFIQDDGNKKVAQAVRADKDPIPNDAKALSANATYFNCGNTVTPDINIKNNGPTAITAMTITPYQGANAGAVTTWAGSLSPGQTTLVQMTPITTTINGGQSAVLNITAVSGTDGNLANNTTNTSFYLANTYIGNYVTEGFLTSAFPPAGWGFENADGGSSWLRVNNAGGYALSSNSAKYNFYANNNIGDADELYMPPFSMVGAITPSLQFDLSYAQYDATTDDQLEVFVSDDCGMNWTSVFNAMGSALATAPPTANGSAFTPATAGDWTTHYLDLSNFNTNNLLVKFRATSDYGNNLYLDNINLVQSGTVGFASEKNNVGVDLFPNPAQNNASVKITAPNAAVASVAVVNVLGQVVVSKKANLLAGANLIQLNTAELANGVYNVIIEAENAHTVKKLTVSH